MLGNLQKEKNVVRCRGESTIMKATAREVITLPVRIMKRLGVRRYMVLTNAAGGVNRAFTIRVH